MMRQILPYEEIERDTRWVAKMTYGRYTGKYAEIKHYAEDSAHFRDMDVTAKQPTEELQHFWDGYFKVIDQYGFMTAKEFYDVLYSRNPAAFDDEPEMREPIMRLSQALIGKDPRESIVVEGCGNHYVCNWLDAMLELKRDYDVINWTKKNGYHTYTIADEEDAIEELSMRSNQIAIRSI